ncbi:DNA polymerase gamma [Rhizodiscina lignyota]|uniref:DNA-directed DNA polymerase n=1 Tax=Rhizodiscina lignyota TaxID=1504668 RepID=A0A9P4IQJ9_9PEZI|nr:DNA polymerase gamma [Rhizodiscina lignyota]
MRAFHQRRLLAQLTRQQRALVQASHATASAVNGAASQRWYSSDTTAQMRNGSDSLSISSQARFNELGVQQLSSHVHPQIFPDEGTLPPPELIELSKLHLSRHDLLGKNQDTAPPVAFDLPSLQGKSLDEHFTRLGMEAAEPYLDYSRKFARASLPRRPRKWVKRSGWTKYHADGRTEAVDAPNESLLTFDTEVMWKETNFACMACAASPTAWYAWISPWLLEESDSDSHLIPLGDPSQPRIVIGHNIGYDRARVAEEYSLDQSKNFFIDTMSLHVAVNGMCSRQRPTWEKHRKSRELQEKISRDDSDADLSAILVDQEEELWVGRSSINSLRDVAKFHCDITIDKARREYFGELDRAGIREKFDELLDYCAADVDITHRVYQRVFPHFLETCPHPVSFAALRHLSAEVLPVDKSWDAYIANAEATYQKLSRDVEERLVDLARKALEIKDEPDRYSSDPWLSQLDWSGQEIKMVKGKKKDDPPRPAARQKLPGMPNWFKDLHPTSSSEIGLTVRTRLSSLLLRLAWDGYPLFWTDKYGFTFQVPLDEAAIYHSQGMRECDFSEEADFALYDDRKHMYFKLPHKDGPLARCTNPLAKGYLQYFESGRLSSDYEFAKEALQMNASCSYWISARDRIMSQMVVYTEQNTTSAPKKRGRRKKNSAPAEMQGFILPQIIPMGTITRRAVENTWLTASNAKANRVGSELKSMIKAPPGYCFVGADVDSQELWIASLVGDAQFQLHGGNAIGFMTLEGTKAAGTDLHSRTAKILGISRNDAKVFNYGRIYGAGQRFATQLLRQFNPTMSDSQASETSTNLYEETKGKKATRKILRDRPFWRGGTESFVFNKLEDFAEEDSPRTPVLGAGITEALMRRYLTKGGFLTSRINWAIQSSGVDYLHLLIVAMDYLTRRFNINARLAITVHDEIRYLVREEDKYRAAMALQVANVWTRAMFAQQMGMDELPQSCAYFSAVDIDHVLRKEVDMDCVTPSHPNPIPPGESLDIAQLLEKGSEAYLDPKVRPKDRPDVAKFEYIPRAPVMKSLNNSGNVAYLKAQIARDNAELNDVVKEGTPARPVPAQAGPGESLRRN